MVASIKRQSKNGDFRSNLHQGGSASGIQLSPIEKQLAVATAKALDLQVCGVDIRDVHASWARERSAHREKGSLSY